MPWGFTERFFKHGNECTRAFVSKFDSHRTVASQQVLVLVSMVGLLCVLLTYRIIVHKFLRSDIR